MPTYSIPLDKIPGTIADNLVKAGALRPQDAPKYIDSLRELDETGLVRTLIHSHELREVRAEAQNNHQKAQKKRGWLLGKLTGMLRPAHVAKGYCLMEDEDFLYLYLPDDKMPPIVFSTRGRKNLDDIIETICRLEGEE